MSELKIRQLTRKDRVTLTELIRKFMSISGDNSLSQLIVADETTSGEKDAEESIDQMSAFGVEILKNLLAVIEEDVSAWFADLLGMKKEEYDNGPINIELVVIDQIISSMESVGFFSQASALYSRTTGLLSGLQKQRKE